MLLYDYLRYRQPQTKAAFSTGPGFIDPVKPFKNTFDICSVNTYAFIIHPDHKLLIMPQGTDCDRAAQRIFDGIIDQDRQQLFQAQPVAPNDQTFRRQLQFQL